MATLVQGSPYAVDNLMPKPCFTKNRFNNRCLDIIASARRKSGALSSVQLAHVLNRTPQVESEATNRVLLVRP